MTPVVPATVYHNATNLATQPLMDAVTNNTRRVVCRSIQPNVPPNQPEGCSILGYVREQFQRLTVNQGVSLTVPELPQ